MLTWTAGEVSFAGLWVDLHVGWPYPVTWPLTCVHTAANLIATASLQLRASNSRSVLTSNRSFAANLKPVRGPSPECWAYSSESMKALLSLLISLADKEVPAPHKVVDWARLTGQVERGITLHMWNASLQLLASSCPKQTASVQTNRTQQHRQLLGNNRPVQPTDLKSWKGLL